MSLPRESSNLAVILEISRHTESRLISNVLLGDFPGGSDGEESTCNAGDLGSISESTRSPGKENRYPLQYSCLENSMDRGAMSCKESDTTEQLSMNACAFLRMFLENVTH